MLRRLAPSTAALAAAFLLALSCSAASRVILESAEVDRAGQVVTLAASSLPSSVAVLRDEAGAEIPLQHEPDGRITFVVPWQPAGQRVILSPVSAPTAPTAAVQVKRDATALQVTIAGRKAVTFPTNREAVPRTDIKEVYKRAGYLHPVYSPAGVVVTGDYPANHPHHHGIWTPWTKTRFQGRVLDFWNMQEKTGAEDLRSVGRTWSGPVHGGFEARLQMLDATQPQRIPVLNDDWQVTAYALRGQRAVTMFDLAVTQTCAGADAVAVQQYLYGGFGFRAPEEFQRFLTSNGETDRVKANNTRARWCYLGGESAGTVTLVHPDNVRAPQPLRVHPTMPYYSFAPQQLGEFTIEPNKPYRARFRFIAIDGQPSAVLFEAYWNGFAQPAKATVE